MIKKKKGPNKSFLLPQVALEQLEELCSLLGLNQTSVVVVALRMLHEDKVGKNTRP